MVVIATFSPYSGADLVQRLAYGVALMDHAATGGVAKSHKPRYACLRAQINGLFDSLGISICNATVAIDKEPVNTAQRRRYLTNRVSLRSFEPKHSNHDFSPGNAK